MRIFWLSTILLIAPVGLHDGRAQPGTVVPATRIVPTETPLQTLRDGSKLPGPAAPIFYSAHRAMEWLKRTNKPDGRFVYGFQPALRVVIDGDNFLSQAGATFALARAARYYRDERGTAIARQAALTLLQLETMLDPQDRSLRYTAAPPNALNRLASHGLLVSAIYELAEPEKCKDLLTQADELCNYLKQQQRSDGSLAGSQNQTNADEFEAAHAGLALQGMMRSHKHRPAEWKIDLVRKAHNYYQAAWQQNKNRAVACSHTPAYAEAYLQTKEPAFAQTVFAMNDWLLGLQYGDDAENVRKQWTGGFPRSNGGKHELAVPDITSAIPAESLADACRVARQAGDLARLKRYERALILNLHYLMTLQYTNAKTEHFVEAFRPAILGAFYASHQDGNLRLDYTQHPVCAMVQYLREMVE